MPIDEQSWPHAPDVHERETSDEGFSAGWGLHQLPAESYVLDCHTHMAATSSDETLALVRRFFARAAAMRLRRLVGIDGYTGRADAWRRAAFADDRFRWMARIRHDEPAPDYIARAGELGAVGLKLHNAPIITGAGDPECWLEAEWHETFAAAGECGLPVLWHVTQRLTDSPYSGGGRDSYWKEGRPKGVQWGNRKLMDVFEQVVADHRDVTFIGAHQMHVGPATMDRLFADHPNLVTDTSCGCMLRQFDEMRPDDRETWRAFFLKHRDRLMFGTDTALGPKAHLWNLWDALGNHIRFVHALRLPQDALEQVMHGNFERIAGLDPCEPDDQNWGAARA